MAFTPGTAVTGTVTVSGDTTNAEQRRISEAIYLEQIRQGLEQMIATERETSQQIGFEIR